MPFVGVDLASQARRTGLAAVSTGPHPVLEYVRVGVGDDEVVGALESATRAGVDVPLGWPVAFAALVSAHAAGSAQPPIPTGLNWMRSVVLRATDIEVHRQTGLTPLSVAADRIAYPALRWAVLEARLRERGINVSRDGSGVVAEVYPAAALFRWSLLHRGYKGAKNTAARSRLVSDLMARTPWLEWNGHEAACVADDNALDAVLAALVAREVLLGEATAPSATEQSLAEKEGWIWLPSDSGPTPPRLPSR